MLEGIWACFTALKRGVWLNKVWKICVICKICLTFVLGYRAEYSIFFN